MLLAAGRVAANLVSEEGGQIHGQPSAARLHHRRPAHGAPLARHRARTDTNPTETTATLAAGSMPVPPSYLGISTEYWSLPAWDSRLSVLERVLSLLEVPGDGPLVIRIGGDSADHTFWNPARERTPAWVYNLTPAWVKETGRIARKLGARLIVDLNLITGSPLKGAEWAKVAERDLPRHSIVAFEIGNEPDIYNRWFWLSTWDLAKNVLPPALSAQSYVQDFEAYARALEPIIGRTPLAGPALANTRLDASWISLLLSKPHPRLGLITAHRYPYNACASPRSIAYPTVPRILSERGSADMAQTVTAAVRLAHQAGLPFRLTELNSVTCGGRRGVSDTVATALWAPDALFELMRTGADGVNIHVRADAINAAFALGPRGLDARPLLYGMLLFTRTIGRDGRLVRVRLTGLPAPGLKAWAVRLRSGRLNVLLINKGSAVARLRLAVARRRPATVERLLAPSPGSTSGVTLGGQHLGRDGRWHGTRSVETILPGSNGYRLTVPAWSAALVKLPG